MSTRPLEETDRPFVDGLLSNDLMGTKPSSHDSHWVGRVYAINFQRYTNVVNGYDREQAGGLLVGICSN